MVKTLNKEEIKERLNNIIEVIENNENLSTENINSIRNEVYSINLIKNRASIFDRKRVSEYITKETFNLLKIKLRGKSDIYKNYIIEVFESLL